MLNGENSVEMIVETLSQDRSDSREVILKDVCRFISKVGKKGLIKAAEKFDETRGFKFI
jgi:hypothetical protein